MSLAARIPTEKDARIRELEYQLELVKKVSGGLSGGVSGSGEKYGGNQYSRPSLEMPMGRSESFERDNRERGPILCWYCGLVGHSARACHHGKLAI